MEHPQLHKEVQWLLKEKYHGVVSKEALADIARLERGEHIDYVIGFVHFLGYTIDLSFRPLIPRPETEEWTKRLIAELLESPKPHIRILDLFAGSGCVGVALLGSIPWACVDFADINPKYAKQIKKNIVINGVNPERYQYLTSNIFSNIAGRYDVIVANPPYIALNKKDQVQSSVLHQEPHEALFGGQEGMRVIKRFITQLREHIHPGGIIYMEFDSHQKDEIGSLLKEQGYTKMAFFKDQFNTWRYVRIVANH